MKKIIYVFLALLSTSVMAGQKEFETLYQCAYKHMTPQDKLAMFYRGVEEYIPIHTIKNQNLESLLKEDWSSKQLDHFWKQIIEEKCYKETQNAIHSPEIDFSKNDEDLAEQIKDNDISSYPWIEKFVSSIVFEMLSNPNLPKIFEETTSEK